MINLKTIWRLASYNIVIGAVAGAGVGAFIGFRVFGGGGAVAGLVLGALLGATIGLDLVLAPLPRAGSQQGQSPPPFTSALLCVLIGAGAILFGAYAWGHRSFTCERSPGGQIDCRQASYFWLGQVLGDETRFPGVYRARQSTPDIVLLSTSEDENDFLTNFPPDTAAQITRFLDSKEASLEIKDNHLWYFPYIFFLLGGGLLLFFRPAFRSAQEKLAEKLKRVRIRERG